MFAWLTRRRRVAIRRRPFSAEWRAIIERNVPYVACLPSEDREELARHIQVFLEEKHFEGCGGLVITGETWDRSHRRCRFLPIGDLAYCIDSIDAAV
jgi:Mlc titration factor MtfA (ptsG expression regulator)